MRRDKDKILALLLAGTVAAGVFLTGCSKAENGDANASDNTVLTEASQDTKTEEKTLVNHMSENELALTRKTDLQLLDKPWEEVRDALRPEGPIEGFYDMTAISVTTKEDLLKEVAEYPENYEDPGAALAEINVLPDDYCYTSGAIVNGELIFDCLPDKDYDGGAGKCSSYHYNLEDYTKSYSVEIEFSDYDDLKKKLREDMDVKISEGSTFAEAADEDYDNIIAIYDAVIDGSVEIIPYETISMCLDYFMENGKQSGLDETAYTWEFSEAAVDRIKDRIDEYHFRDDELDMGFTVHVVTPSGYDPDKEYPAIVLTDAVWRFGDIPVLERLMDEGDAPAYIIITVGFEYDVDGWDNEIRADIFCVRKKEFLDFITDNMMPYLVEKYAIDLDDCTLFGHSQGGVFTHYAAFNSDLYENRPFTAYIIGSPTFWTPYFTVADDWEEYKNDYGYFDRNEKADFYLFITGGKLEDEDYEEYFLGNDSTLEGIEHLKERLEAAGDELFDVKLYPSHHYQYVSSMIREYIRGDVRK